MRRPSTGIGPTGSRIKFCTVLLGVVVQKFSLSAMQARRELVKIIDKITVCTSMK